MELDTAREIGEVALSALIKELGSGAVISDNLDLLKEFDSVDLVSLILETEELIEQRVGRYVPLATEDSFDDAKSPFRSMECWVQFISDAVHEK